MNSCRSSSNGVEHVNKSNTSKYFYILFSIAAFMILLDGAVTTPIALVCIDGAYETNLIYQQWNDVMGVKYFFYLAPLIILLVFVIGRGLERIAYDLFKKSNDVSVLMLYRWPAYLFLLLVILIFTMTVINNVEIISGGI